MRTSKPLLFLCKTLSSRRSVVSVSRFRPTRLLILISLQSPVRLPPEVVRWILELVLHQNNMKLGLQPAHAELAKCCLISKQFLEPARSFLYYDVLLDDQALLGNTSRYTSTQDNGSSVRGLALVPSLNPDINSKIGALLAACRNLKVLDNAAMPGLPLVPGTRFDTSGLNWSFLVMLRLTSAVIVGDSLVSAPSLECLVVGAVVFSALACNKLIGDSNTTTLPFRLTDLSLNQYHLMDTTDFYCLTQSLTSSLDELSSSCESTGDFPKRETEQEVSRATQLF
jgi:hypothetical protein